jgi:hypothetical protein
VPLGCRSGRQAGVTPMSRVQDRPRASDRFAASKARTMDQ